MFGAKALPCSLGEMVGTATLFVAGFFGALWLVLLSFGTALIVPHWYAGNGQAVLLISLETIAPLLAVTLFGSVATYSTYCLWAYSPRPHARGATNSAR